jgi:hypothetical protein
MSDIFESIIQHNASNIGYLFSQTVIHPETREYVNILCVNCKINGPLGNFLVKYSFKKPSPYHNGPNTECLFAIKKNIYTNFDLLTTDNLSDFIVYLTQNQYNISHEFQHIRDHHVNKKHICMFTYNG